MENRIAAILVGIALMFSLMTGWSVPWYFALPLAALGYGCIRYVGYFLRERRYMKNVLQEVDEVARNAKLRDQK
jgi:hypothetical protein